MSRQEHHNFLSNGEYCDVGSVEELHERIDELLKANILLKSEVDYQIKRNDRMRDALVTARSAIETLTSRSRLAAEVWRRSRFSQYYINVRARIAWYTRRKLDGQACITHAALEVLVLKSTRERLRSVQRVYIDFDLLNTDNIGPNWRITGVTSGKADPEDAMAAARAAAYLHRALKMVEDRSAPEGPSPARLRIGGRRISR